MIGSTIQRELAEFIMRELNDPRLPTIVSITRVKVTDDLEYADVYVSIMGTEGQQNAALIALKHSAGLMRSRLTRSLSIRQAPFIRFQMDEQLKKELEILEVLDRLRVEREQDEARKRGEAVGGGAEGAESAGPAEQPDAAGRTDEAAEPQPPDRPEPDRPEPDPQEQKRVVDGQDPSEQQSPT